MKATIFHKNEHTNIIITKPGITSEECKENFKYIRTIITSQYLSSRKNYKVTSTTPYDIHSSKQLLPRHIAYAQNWHSSELTITTLAKLPAYSIPRYLHTHTHTRTHARTHTHTHTHTHTRH